MLGFSDTVGGRSRVAVLVDPFLVYLLTSNFQDVIQQGAGMVV